MIFNLAQNDDPNSGWLGTGKSTKFSLFGALDKKEAYADAEEAVRKYNDSLGGVDNGLTKKIIADTKLQSLSMGEYLESLGKAPGSVDGYKASLKSLTVAQKAAKIGQVALNTALNMGIAFLAASVVSFIAKEIDAAIHKTENLIKAGEEAAQAIASISDEYKGNAKTVNDVAADYARLAQGTDQATGKNKTLSTDGYAEFLDISNQLAEIFPDLVKGYDSNGNAILRLNGKADAITGTFQKLLKTEQELANLQIVEQLPTQFEGVSARAEEAQKEITIQGLDDAGVKEKVDAVIASFSADVEGALVAKTQELNTIWSSLNESMIAWLGTNSQYQSMSDAMKSAVQSTIIYRR